MTGEARGQRMTPSAAAIKTLPLTTRTARSSAPTVVVIEVSPGPISGRNKAWQVFGFAGSAEAKRFAHGRRVVTID